MKQTDFGPSHICVVSVIVPSSFSGMPGNLINEALVPFLQWLMFWERTGHHPSNRLLTCKRNGRYFLG